MCGFAGYLSHTLPGNAGQILRAMTDAIRERGPDSEGQWMDEAAGLALGHRRLAVVDLSTAGHQPMVSASGRYVIAFNGEIYNHHELRTRLNSASPDHFWRGHSDTETLLAAIERWGLEETLRRAVGMFGLALWDRERRELQLARDRMGEKPLYFGWQGQGEQKAFLFGSDLKALCPHPTFRFEVDRNGLTSLLRFGYVAQPLSIFDGISKLEPGMIASVSLAQPQPSIKPYWNFQEVVANCSAQRLAGTAQESAEELEHLLKQAISLQMEADVPVGAFLSGGVDSSMIASLMQEIALERGQAPVRTFTIGFEDAEFDEAPFARAVARHLGTDHVERYLTSADALNVIPKLPSIYSEPFADSSQIPTYLVSSMAKDFVTVSLSGDAGDELFCGYTRYQLGPELLRLIKFFPIWARKLGGIALRNFGQDKLSSVYDFARPILPKVLHLSNIQEKFRKLERIIDTEECYESNLFNFLISHWHNASEVVIGGSGIASSGISFANFDGNSSFIEQMMIEDTTAYLPNDILCKVDRAAMAVSLETRVPLLDHRIVEHALRMPLSHKLHQGVTKSPLRKILYKRVPRELIERPKKGFGIPLASWLRGPLREWAEELLDETRLRQECYFDVRAVRQSLDFHMSGKSDESARLWCVLMFQQWKNNQFDSIRR